MGTWYRMMVDHRVFGVRNEHLDITWPSRDSTKWNQDSVHEDADVSYMSSKFILTMSVWTNMTLFSGTSGQRNSGKRINNQVCLIYNIYVYLILAYDDKVNCPFQVLSYFLSLSLCISLPFRASNMACWSICHWVWGFSYSQDQSPKSRPPSKSPFFTTPNPYLQKKTPVQVPYHRFSGYMSVLCLSVMAIYQLYRL